jgi:mRNA interferase RelE/StbE
MNEFDVLLTDEAKDDLRHLSHSVQSRLLDKLEWLGTNASLLVHQALKVTQWAGVYKYRVGDYRILYLLDIEHRRLTVLKVGHRREVYKR